MPRTRPNTVRHTLKDGTLKIYRYDRAKKRKAPEQGSLGWCIRQYLVSTEFQNLRPGTKTLYRRALLLLEPIRHFHIDQVKRQHLLRIRDAASRKPGKANTFVTTASVFFAWALDRGHRADFSPAQRLKRLPLRRRAPWPDDALEVAKQRLDGPLWLAFMLGRHTGQRIGDILSLRWSQYQDGLIHLVQQKTGVELWIPVAPELADALAKQEKRGLTIVTRNDGQPYTANGFGTMWKQAMKRIGLEGLLFHELRHTAATKLAEAGATAFEVGAITGHQSLPVLQGYVQAAERKRLAQSAMAKVVNLPNGKKTPRKTLKINDK